MWCTNVIRELKGLRYSQEEAALSNHGDHVGVHRLYVHQKKLAHFSPLLRTGLFMVLLTKPHISLQISPLIKKMSSQLLYSQLVNRGGFNFIHKHEK